MWEENTLNFCSLTNDFGASGTNILGKTTQYHVPGSTFCEVQTCGTTELEQEIRNSRKQLDQFNDNIELRQAIEDGDLLNTMSQMKEAVKHEDRRVKRRELRKTLRSHGTIVWKRKLFLNSYARTLRTFCRPLQKRLDDPYKCCNRARGRRLTWRQNRFTYRRKLEMVHR